MTGRTTELLPYISRRAAGGSPLFPPEHSSEAEAREAVMDLVRRTPRSMGLGRTRWTLGLLAQEMKAVGDIPEDITRGGFYQRRILEAAGSIGNLLQAGPTANAKSGPRLRPDYEERR